MKTLSAPSTVSSSFLQGQPQVTHCKVGRTLRVTAALSCSFLKKKLWFLFFTFFSTNRFKAKLISSCWCQHIQYNILQQKQECLRMNRCYLQWVNKKSLWIFFKRCCWFLEKFHVHPLWREWRKMGKKVENDKENRLAFLIICFPKISRAQVYQLWVTLIDSKVCLGESLWSQKERHGFVWLMKHLEERFPTNFPWRYMQVQLSGNRLFCKLGLAQRREHCRVHQTSI